jgi:DnaJ like chaperone protein
MGKAKWIFGGLGFVLGGPIGALIGIVLGSLFEGKNALPGDWQKQTQTEEEDTTRERTYTRNATAGDIKIALLVLIACVMKADGRVLKSELNFIKPFLLKTYGEEEAKQALQLLKKMLEREIDVPAVTRQIAQHVNYSTRLEIVHLLLDLANADGDFAPEEESLIEQIAAGLNIKTNDYNSLAAMYRKTKDPNWAYTALEIEPSASDEEVKKAYRRMAMKYHPDKVANAGEEIKKQATEKFRTINEAYEHIKLLRSIK